MTAPFVVVVLTVAIGIEVVIAARVVAAVILAAVLAAGLILSSRVVRGSAGRLRRRIVVIVGRGVIPCGRVIVVSGVVVIVGRVSVVFGTVVVGRTVVVGVEIGVVVNVIRMTKSGVDLRAWIAGDVRVSSSAAAASRGGGVALFDGRGDFFSARGIDCVTIFFLLRSRRA